ncbi:MAG: ATP-binding cassette domain-containing protein [Marinobacter sp.]
MNLTPDMTSIQALTSILRGEPRRLPAALILALLASLAEMVPWVALWLAARAVMVGDPVVGHSLMAGGAIVLRYLLFTAGVWQAHLAAYGAIQRVRAYLVATLARMPVSRLRAFHRGDLEKRVITDSQALEPLIAHHGVDIVNGVAMPLLLIGLLFVIDWRLGLVALAPLPLALLIQIVMMRGFTERQAHYNDIVARMHEAQLEFLRSIGVMKLYGVDADSFRQLDRAMVVHQSMTADYIRQLIGAWVGFVTVAQASLFFLVPLAIVLVAAGTLSLADGVVAAIVAAGMLKPWLALTQLVGQVSETFVAVARLLSLCPQQEATKGSLDEPLQSLACRNLTLSRGGRTLFRELTLTVIPGQQAVLQGASGGGKSSLLELLSGQLAPDQGDWLLNGHAISTLTDECRARYVASVSQQAFFFRGSIADNLRLACPNQHESELWGVLKVVQIADLVRTLPARLDTDMGETRRNFSGGELQRLAIARALLANTPVLILDEATSHLDNRTEREVLTGVRNYAPTQIQLVISHRHQAVRTADRVWTLTDGELTVAEGKNHD